MTAGLVGQNQISTFVTPVNGTSPIDANSVRGNDNTIKASYDLHDSDGTIHLQSSLAGSRPAAGTAGRKWLDTDTLKVYYDTGSVWSEIAYFSSSGGTITGNVTITGTLTSGLINGQTISSAANFTGTVTVASTITGNLTGNVTGNVSGSSGSTTGNAATATALATGRTISVSGDMTYTSPSFDGTANVTAAGTLATVNSNVGSFGSSSLVPVITVNGKGLITAVTTSAVSVVAPAGTLTGTTLASNVVTASITTLTAGLTVTGNISNVAAGADISAGGTIAGPNINGTSSVTGAAYRTTVGSTSIPTGTATTIFAGTANSMYLVFAFEAAAGVGGGVAALGSATGIAGTLGAGFNITLSLSGLNVQLTHSAGSTKTIAWAAFRIA